MPEEAPRAPINRELTLTIVAAYVRRNQIASDQITALISTIHHALVDLGNRIVEDSGSDFDLGAVVRRYTAYDDTERCPIPARFRQPITNPCR